MHPESLKWPPAVPGLGGAAWSQEGGTGRPPGLRQGRGQAFFRRCTRPVWGEPDPDADPAVSLGRRWRGGGRQYAHL